MARRGGGVLPNLLPADDRDQAMAKRRQYLAELQAQAEQERQRKLQDRGVGQYIPGQQQQISPGKERPVPGGGGGGGSDGRQGQGQYGQRQQQFSKAGFDRADVVSQLRAGFAQALNEAGGDGRPQGPRSARASPTNDSVMIAMRRWEELFTTQIASSFEATGDLANRLSDLESRLSMEVREKAQLKERQEHAELIQADLHRSKIELESALKNSENARMEQSKRFEAEIRGLRDAFSESQMGHQRELSKAERRGEELEQVLEENKRASEALLSRVQALEETNRESLTRLEELSSQERSHERHSAEKLNDAEMRTSEVLMRIETMEKNLLPSAKQYIDGTFQTYWGPTQAEIQGVHRELGELAGRIGRVDSASADTVQSIKEEADRGYRRVIDTLNDTIKTTLDRFGNVEAAMDEERRKRDEVGRRVGEEVEKLKAQMAESLQSADKDHAGLVEAVHSRMMQRLSQQEDLTSVLSEAIEGKRAFLEEVVRAEIKSRFDSVEQLRGEIASKASDLDEAFDKVREEVRAQSKLLAVKLRSATRTVKNAANESEQTRRLAEQATQDIGREMQGMTQQSLQVENELRAAFKAGLGDLQLQISAVRQLAEQGGGGAPAVSQERRDEGQDERISGVREQCVALASEVDALKHALEQEAARAKREEGLLRDRQDDILGDAARRTHESLARVEGELQRQSTRTETAENALHQAKMRVEALEEDVVSGPRKVLEELGAKIERGEEAQRSSEERMNARIRELHDTCLTGDERLSQLVEQTRGSLLGKVAGLEVEDAKLRGAIAKEREEAKARMEENRAWRSSVEAKVEKHQDAALRMREAVAGDIRRLDESLAAMRRDHGARFSKLDAKLTDDIRGIVKAIAEHKEHGERMQEEWEVTSKRMADDVAAALERVRGEVKNDHIRHRKMIGEVVSSVEEEKKGRREELQKLEIKVDRERAASAAERDDLADKLQSEVRSREDRDKIAREEMANERGERQRALGELAIALDGVRKEGIEAARRGLERDVEDRKWSEGRTEELSKNVQELIQHIKEVEVEAHACEARLAGHEMDSAKERERLREGVVEAQGMSRKEEAERQAAITEVYKRIETGRALDALMARMAEDNLQAKVESVRMEVAAAGEKNGLAVESGINAVKEALEGLEAKEEKLEGDVRVLEGRVGDGEVREKEREAAVDKRIDGVELLQGIKHQEVLGKVGDLSKGVDSMAKESKEALEAESRERKAADEAVKEVIKAEKAEREAANGDLRKHVDQKAKENTKAIKDASDKQKASSGEFETKLARLGSMGDEAVQKLAAVVEEKDEEIKALVEKERSERAQADDELKGMIAADKEEALKAVAELDGKIEDEKKERLSAMEEVSAKTGDSLEARLAADKEERVQAEAQIVSDLEAKLDAEREERAAGDAKSAEELERVKGEMEQAVEAEKAERVAEDERLSSANTELSGRLDTIGEDAAKKAEEMQGKLQAQEEALKEGEEKTTAQIQSQVASLEERVKATEEGSKALEDKVADVDGRLNKIEGAGYVSKEDADEAYGAKEDLGKIRDKVDEMDAASKAAAEGGEKSSAEVAGQVSVMEERLNKLESDKLTPMDERVKALEEKKLVSEEELDKTLADRGYCTGKEVDEKVQALNYTGEEQTGAGADPEALGKLEAEIKKVAGDLQEHKSLRDGDLTRIEALENAPKEKAASPTPPAAEAAPEGGDNSALQARVEALEKGHEADIKRVDEKLAELEEGKADKKETSKAIADIGAQVSQAAELRKSDVDALGKLSEKVGKLSKKVGGSSAGTSPEPGATGEGGASSEALKEAVAKAEEEMQKNLDFRIEALKVDDLRKEVKELTSITNVNSRNIDKSDQKVKGLEEDRDRMAEEAKQLEDKLSKYKKKTDKKMESLKTTCETLLNEKLEDWEAEKAEIEGQ